MGHLVKFSERLTNRFSRVFFEFLTKAPTFRKSNGSGLIKFLEVSLNDLRIFYFVKNPHFKKFIDSRVPIDPLRDLGCRETSLTVLIPCSAKDFGILSKVIKEARLNIKNQIFEIVVVTPDANLLPKGLGQVRVLSDKHFLEQPKIKNLLDGLHFDSGWIRQQLIKILFCLEDSADNVLILDADTILRKPKTFVSGKIQLLSFAYEYHVPYIRHMKQFSPKIQDFGLTFVTHHQLWQKDVVSEIWSGKRLGEWLSSLDRDELSPISEYNTYGMYMYNFHCDRVKLSRFANDQFSRKLLNQSDSELTEVCSIFPNSCSISVHSYS
jgi:hypothetical protein